MKVPVTLDIKPPTPVGGTPPKWWQSLQRVYQQAARVINGNLEVGSPTAVFISSQAPNNGNVFGNWVSVLTPATPNTDFTVIHNIGRPPIKMDIGIKSSACIIYVSPTPNPNPNTQAILRATTFDTITIHFQ